MKKLVYGLACLFLILSCDIPESITVKGNPGLYVPLGSPFAGLKEGERLEDLISKDKIREMMNSNASGAGNGLVIYDVSETMAQNHGIDPKVQTYLVQYPLTEMPLNLKDYLDDAINAVNTKGDITIPSVSGVTGTLPAGTYYYIYGDGSTPGTSDITNNPFIKIPLNDMVKLVKKVSRDPAGRFGMEINYTPQLAQYLEFKIPALGINSYIKGTPYPPASPAKLLYVDQSGTDFFPRNDLQKTGDDSELWVYARISGPCAGNLTPEMHFEWTKALINTDTGNGSAFKAEYPIENSLSDFLGGGISFNKVDGYVYMSGLTSGSSIKMTVDTGNSQNQIRNLIEATPSFTVTEKSDGTKIADGSLTVSSFTGADTSPLNLAPVFEGAGAVLKVVVDIEDIEITHSEAGDRNVKINLYTMIPLNLKISAVPGKEAPNVTVGGVNVRNNYVPLDLGDTLAKMGTGDLFGREEGKDNLIKEIDSVEIIIKDVDISIIGKDNLVVLVKNKDNYNLLEFNNNASLKFDSGNLSAPFSPEFTVLLKKDTANSGSFKILRAESPKFDFKLDVKAKAKINYTQKF